MAKIAVELSNLDEVYFLVGLGVNDKGEISGEWAEPNYTAPMERQDIVKALRSLADVIEEKNVALKTAQM
jgi:hypothetical protein